MKIVIDTSPLQNENLLKHRVRGTGFYIENLKKTLLAIDKKNTYIFLEQKSDISTDIDVIHYPYFEPFFLTLPHKKKYKTIVTVHDLTPLVFPKYFPSGIKGTIKWMIQKKSLSKADAIITDSYASKKDIITYAGIDERKIYVVYLAASGDFRHINVKEKLNNLCIKYNLPRKFALYVGDATWNKNLPRLLEAIERNNIQLVMVGSALKEKKIDVRNSWNGDLIIVQNKIKSMKNVKVLGFVPTEDLVGLYNLATVFVMPSIYEGFGLPALEAMRCGCPVVVGNGGSLPEVVGNAGIYVDPYLVSDISDKILRVFSSKEIQEYLCRKSLTQAKKFTWDKTGAQTIEVYEK